MNQTESQQQGTDLRLMLSQADALCLEKRFDEAASIYQHLVQLTESRLGPTHSDTILVVQRLADALYAMNAFRDCLPLYERLCQIARGMLGDGDPDVINLMFKIARTQELIGSFVEARATYEFAIGTAKRNLPPGHQLASQLQGRYEVLLERIEENKRAAQAWKENTVSNPVVSFPQAQPPTERAPAPPPPTMPGLQMPAGIQSSPLPGAMQPPVKSMLPPHMAMAAPAQEPPVPGPPSHFMPDPAAPAPFQAPMGMMAAPQNPGMLQSPPGPGMMPPPSGMPQGGPPSAGAPASGLPFDLAGEMDDLLGVGAGNSAPVPGLSHNSPPAIPGGPPPFSNAPPAPANPFPREEPRTLANPFINDQIVEQSPQPPGAPPPMVPQDLWGKPRETPDPWSVQPQPQPVNRSVPEPLNPPRLDPAVGSIGAQLMQELGREASLMPAPAAPPQLGLPMPGGNGGFAPANPGGFPTLPSPGGPNNMVRGSSAEGLMSNAGPPLGSPLPAHDPFPDAGRKSNPDPYLEHLAAKVAGLKAQAQGGQYEEPAPSLPSSFTPRVDDDERGWHEGVAIPTAERSEPQEPPRRRSVPTSGESTAYGGQQEDEYGGEQEVERRPTKRKIKTARDAASKSEDLVSRVRAFKEYLIPVVVLVVVIVGGYFFISATASRTPTQPPSVVVTPEKLQGHVELYASADNAMRLAVGSSSCTFVQNDSAVTLPYVIYDGNWSTCAMQAIDSLMEKQIWFTKMPEGIVTDAGTVLYDKAQPDFKVMKSMATIASAANALNLTGKGYPKRAQDIQQQAFVYSNPFTGENGVIKIVTLPEVNKNRDSLISQLRSGVLMQGETAFTRGEVRCYAIIDAASGIEKGVGFFVRGADRSGNYFRTLDGTQVVTIGFMGGADSSNTKMVEDSKAVPTTPVKPTKVWIAKNQFLPVFFLYHSLPISMAVLSLLCFWRSLMVAPGQESENATNRGFRMFAFVALAVCIITAAIQFTQMI